MRFEETSPKIYESTDRRFRITERAGGFTLDDTDRPKGEFGEGQHVGFFEHIQQAIYVAGAIEKGALYGLHLPAASERG